LGLALSLWGASAHAAPTPKAHKATGREAVKAVRQDWKGDAFKGLHALDAKSLKLPANFRTLSAADRLSYLHARRDLNAARFDKYHPQLGRFLAIDDRLRAAQSQDCRPMSGLLPNNAHFRYLQFRRNLDPARFDFYHASLGALLAQDNLLKSGQPCVAGEIIPPPLPTPTGTPSPSGPTGSPSNPSDTPFPPPPPGVGIGTTIFPPRAVPEPGSLTLISLGLVGATIPRMVRRWRNRPIEAE